VFHDFVRDFAGESVEIDTSESNCDQLRCGDDSAELVTSDAEEYPVVPRFDSAEAYSLQAGTFTALVNKTAFAAAREQGRYAMHGVLAEVGDGILKMVATDGRRLGAGARADEHRCRRANPGKPAIVPTKGMQLFCRVMSDPLDQVKLTRSATARSGSRRTTRRCSHACSTASSRATPR
jgi:DNA polymerase-3 subunit beta